ncbi:hypothetical protein MT340_009015 [Staphylococcus sp. NRL 16/872]|uniref:hypothetical protein n=1 Tax=Staphylococcus sp. NRL 16/872 TaxID=2930131 RepID=UPI001FB492BA|nr:MULTISPECIES: hypothetical protein [unclassified Staphylococcus]MCJ1656687.1 hypothetical protein [Staphylococcus sp. NRL 21/187]MCJ1662439.1 hypothetical protein [Staphylococcus sp. NRL 18/288]WEN68746.1 hypothetical protein MT340_009015 [Staphylococcus sp. NRL 16/872]
MVELKVIESQWNRDNLYYTNANFKNIEKILNELLSSIIDVSKNATPTDGSINSDKIKDKAITNIKLADQFSSVRSLIDGEDVTQINKEGIYFKTTTSRLKGLPTQLNDNGYGYSGFLVVKPFSQYHYIQELYDLNNTGIVYNRTVKNNADTDWKSNSDDVKVSQIANDQVNNKLQYNLNVFEKYNSDSMPETNVKYANAIQNIRIEGVDPKTPVKIWTLSRAFSTWNYRIIIGQKVNGKWTTLLDTGSNFTVVENTNGATDVLYEKGGVKLSARIDYRVIPKNDRYIDQRTIDDEPYLIIRPEKVGSVSNTNFSGGEAYDQKLNTTNDVEFNTVNAKSVNTKALYIDSTFPNGTLTAPPTNIKSGDLWLDVTDSTKHPILRVMK